MLAVRPLNLIYLTLPSARLTLTFFPLTLQFSLLYNYALGNRLAFFLVWKCTNANLFCVTILGPLSPSCSMHLTSFFSLYKRSIYCRKYVKAGEKKIIISRVSAPLLPTPADGGRGTPSQCVLETRELGHRILNLHEMVQSLQLRVSA